jgi:HEAT repeat protein
MKKLSAAIVALILCLPAGIVHAGEDSAADLAKMLKNPKLAGEVLTALRATDDKDLAPFFIAMTYSGDKDRRLFATSALADIAGKDAAATLSQRLAKDTSMTIRTEALIALAVLQSVDQQQLVDAMKTSDEGLQLIAARTAIHQKNPAIAADTLKTLANSKDPATAGMAQMSMLGLGDSSVLTSLRETFTKTNPPTDPAVLTILLDQMVEEKIAAGGELAQAVTKADQPWQVRLRAYRSLAAVRPDGAKLIYEAILANAQAGTVFQVHLLGELAGLPQHAEYLEKLKDGDTALAVLARFELARPAGGQAASDALAQAVALGHPVVIDYLLSCAREDFLSNATNPASTAGDAGKDAPAFKADFYVPMLLELIESVKVDPLEVRDEHVRATKASTMLADYGSPAAMAGLQKLLSGNYRPAMRMAAAGLIKTKNPQATNLLRPMLASPYEEMSTDAALVLGHFGDKDAAACLKDITDHSDNHSTILVAFAHWYQLKIQGKTRQAAETLARDELSTSQERAPANRP